MNGFTDFLYARPSFVEGIARSFDFGDALTEYNQSVSGEQADNIALAMDWQAIGEDMRRAVSSFRDDFPGKSVRG